MYGHLGYRSHQHRILILECKNCDEMVLIEVNQHGKLFRSMCLLGEL